MSNENSSCCRNLSEEEIPVENSFQIQRQAEPIVWKVRRKVWRPGIILWTSMENLLLFLSYTNFIVKKVSIRVERALHTITPQPKMYCIDSDSNICINHLVVRHQNLSFYYC